MTLEDLKRELDFTEAVVNKQIRFCEKLSNQNYSEVISYSICQCKSILNTLSEFKKSLQKKIDEFENFQKILYEIGIFSPYLKSARDAIEARVEKEDE